MDDFLDLLSAPRTGEVGVFFPADTLCTPETTQVVAAGIKVCVGEVLAAEEARSVFWRGGYEDVGVCGDLDGALDVELTGGGHWSEEAVGGVEDSVDVGVHEELSGGVDTDEEVAVGAHAASRHVEDAGALEDLDDDARDCARYPGDAAGLFLDAEVHVVAEDLDDGAVARIKLKGIEGVDADIGDDRPFDDQLSQWVVDSRVSDGHEQFALG
jgi:hypothetical protein